MASYYKIFCVTDNQYEYSWSDTPPTICPINSEHEVLAGSTTLVKKKFNKIIISQKGQGDFETIDEAFAYNNGQMDTVFEIYPATYTINNPITIPEGGVIYSPGNAENTFIIAQNPSQDLIILGTRCEIRGVSLIGSTSARGIYFDCTQSGGQGKFSAILECFVKNCYIGIESDGKFGGGFLDSLYSREVLISPLSTPLYKGIYCHSGGSIISISTQIIGIPGYFPIDIGVHCVDATTKVSMTTTSVYFCNTGVLIDNNADCETQLLTCKYNNKSIMIGSQGTGSRFSASTLEIKASNIYDMDIQSTKATIEIHSGVLDNFLIHNPNNAIINAKYHILRYGKYYQEITGNVLFGNSRNPTITYMGEGNHDINNIYVYSNSSLEEGTWVNNTNGAISDTPPQFDMFQSTSVNNCCYIGRSRNIPGLSVQVITATTSPTNISDFVWEYWNGATWISFPIMQNYSTTPHNTVLLSFVSQVDQYNLRFGITSQTDIVSKTLDNIDVKWVRCRIINAISSIPVLEFLKVHPNSNKIDGDGSVQYFGDARMVKSTELTSSIIPVSSTTDQNLYIDQSLMIGLKNNTFPAGSDAKIGLILTLPISTDTSFPYKLNLSYIGDNDTDGTIEWKIRYFITTNNSNVYKNFSDAPELISTSITKTQTITDKNQTYQSLIPLDISGAQLISTSPKNILWITIQRLSQNDTYSGSIHLSNINSTYVEWCQGIHLLSF